MGVLKSENWFNYKTGMSGCKESGEEYRLPT